MPKKENELKYLQVPLPKGRASYRIVKSSWQGMNRREVFDTGVLSDCSNVSTNAAPYLTPSQKRVAINDEDYYADPISLHGFDDFLIAVYKDGTSVKADYITADNKYTGTLFSQLNKSGSQVTEDGITTIRYTIVSGDSHKHLVFNTNYNIIITLPLLSSNIRFSIENKGIGYITFNAQSSDKIITSNGEVTSFIYYNDYNKVDVECGSMWAIVNTGITTDEYIKSPRSIVKFNVYSDTSDPVSGNFIEKLLIFPDRKSMDFKIFESFTPADIDGMPRMNYVTVHNSRLFGVDDDRIYASGFNDYSNWTLDTADETNADNAWVSTAQANTKANGKFTGITAFSGHIICFKADYMHELYNNKNPYRIQDIYAEGTFDNRSIAEVDGRLIFADTDEIKIYTGGNPRNIGRPLGIDNFVKAVSGSDGRNYYLYCEDADGNMYLFVYDTLVNQWSRQSCTYEIISFAKNSNGMYMMSAGGAIYKLDTGVYDGVEWYAETDIHLNKTLDIKHIRKIQFLADIEAESTLKVYALLNDSTGATSNDLVYEVENDGDDTLRLPIRIAPLKTASYGFRLQIRGTGYVKLYPLETSVYEGGELFEYGKL